MTSADVSELEKDFQRLKRNFSIREESLKRSKKILPLKRTFCLWNVVACLQEFLRHWSRIITSFFDWVHKWVSCSRRESMVSVTIIWNLSKLPPTCLFHGVNNKSDSLLEREIHAIPWAPQVNKYFGMKIAMVWIRYIVYPTNSLANNGILMDAWVSLWRSLSNNGLLDQ